MRSRWLGATVALLGSALTTSACGDDPPAAGAGATLPPVITTSTSTTTIAPVTTVPTYYEIQRNDTLTKIAVAFGLPVQAIMQLNGITNPDAIQAGQIIQLPSPDIVARSLPPTVPGQTAPTMPGETTTTPDGAAVPATTVA
jgi:LysM repeat protein